MPIFLLGQQIGYTLYPCFICLWDSHARNYQWVKNGWHLKILWELVKLTSPMNLQLPKRKSPFHRCTSQTWFDEAACESFICMQLGIISTICRALPALSIEKLKAAIFGSPQICKPIKDKCFVQTVTTHGARCLVIVCFSHTERSWQLKSWKLPRVGEKHVFDVGRFWCED